MTEYETATEIVEKHSEWTDITAACDRAMNKREVYTHLVGRKIKFSFRYHAQASVAGWFERRYHDGAIAWHWHKAPGLGHEPTSQWLHSHCPQ